MNIGKLLWVDDEIEMLRAQILFLEKKGYEVIRTTNGADAIDLCQETNFDLIMLDENMPGLSGLETLQQIKTIQPSTPVVMVTKSEEEDIMNQAIGAKIADYLIKPVNPNQILLTLKKIIHRQEIESEAAVTGYREAFGTINRQIDETQSIEDWKEIYKSLVGWEMQLSTLGEEMSEMLKLQKQEANNAFAKFIRKNYEGWFLSDKSPRPILSHDIIKERVLPLLDKKEKVFLLIIDNFRYDQWKAISEELSEIFTYDEELYLSILPTVTHYARNAICAGLSPMQIQKHYPHLWIGEEDEEGKNINEKDLLASQMERFRRRESFSYYKLNDSVAVDKLLSQFHNLLNNDLNVLVVNFIDIMSHARTEQQMVHELVGTDQALRSITQSWFQNTSIKYLFKGIAQSGYKLILTTDHGSIQVWNPTPIIGDRQTNTNLRYKVGKNLAGYKSKDVFELKKPALAQLPSPNLSSSFVFTTGDRFFAYSNNYNYYVNFYQGSFQHGGISMEEMIIPLITLQNKK